MDLVPLRFNRTEYERLEGLNLHRVRRDAYEYGVEGGTTRTVDCTEFTFDSQKFLGRVWRHRAFLYEPRDTAPELRERGLIVSTFMRFSQDEVGETQGREAYGLRSAALLGMPVLVFAPLPDSTGYVNEDAWQNEAMGRYMETGDINETSVAAIVTAFERTMTAMSAMLDTTMGQFILVGSSKRAGAIHGVMRNDPRVVSAVTSGYIPLVTATGEIVEDDYVVNANAKMPTENANLIRLVVEPRFKDHVRFLAEQFGMFAEDYRGHSLFLSLGTNDYACRPDLVKGFVEQLGPEAAIYCHPNGGHDPLNLEQARACQYWAAHRFLGTPIPSVRRMQAVLRDGALQVEAQLDDLGLVQDVELAYTPVPLSKWESATWETVGFPMNGQCSGVDGRVSLPSATDECMCYLRLKVRSGNIEGWVSSPVHRVRQESYVYEQS